MNKAFLLLIIFMSIKNTAQTTNSTQSRIKVFTPSSDSKNTRSSDEYKWVAKTDLIAILTGEFPLIAEYRIAKRLGVEGSIAATQTILPGELGTTHESYYSTTPTLGSAFRASIKYYPSDDYDALEGWSFGLQLYSKTLNRKYDQFSSSTSDSDQALLSAEKDSTNKTGFSIIISKQLFSESNIVFEYTFGFGFANVTNKYFTNEYDSASSKFMISQVNKSESKPNFYFGLRIGFGK